jgi:hypothetical protein
MSTTTWTPRPSTDARTVVETTRVWRGLQVLAGCVGIDSIGVPCDWTGFFRATRNALK